MKRASSLIAIVLAVICCAAFTEEQKTITLHSSAVSQPPSERAVQDKLPQSHDPTWKILAATKISEDKKTGFYSADIPPEVKKLVGTQVTVSGFILPLEEKEKFHHLILSRRTPVCPFCPPGEPYEMLDVMLAQPTLWDENMVTVTGTFGLMNNQEKGLFFKLTNAKKK